MASLGLAHSCLFALMSSSHVRMSDAGCSLFNPLQPWLQPALCALCQILCPLRLPLPAACSLAAPWLSVATNYTEHYMAALLPLVVASDDDEDDEEGACKPKVERMFLRFMRRFFFEAATDGESIIPCSR